MIGTTSSSHAAVLDEYVAKFKNCIVINKSRSDWVTNKREILNWTKEICGPEYKNWFCNVGGLKDPNVSFYFIDTKRASWFALRWGDYVV